MSFAWMPTLPLNQSTGTRASLRFYLDANFAIEAIDGQLEVEHGVTEFYVNANFAIGPIDWQLELDQGGTEFLHGRQLCHQTN